MKFNENDLLDSLVDVFDKDVDEMNIDDIFKEYDEWDSVAALSLVASIEDNFEIIISGDDIDSFSTIRDILNFINK
tara:strand:- start:725 stop:952 length:228 start_codon:yes stop_codon:yes gene_type:complete